MSLVCQGARNNTYTNNYYLKPKLNNNNVKTKLNKTISRNIKNYDSNCTI